MARLTDLATVARRTGYPVVEVPGWRSRGSSAFNRPRSVIVHHTASGSKSGNAPSLNVCTHGRPGLSGPLCQLLLARNGTIYVVASGRANHAGVVNATKYSNSNSIGIEAENNGVGESWPSKQMDAYAKLCRELCDAYGISINDVRGHKEVCSPKGRKIDPTFAMGSFRTMVRNRKGSGSSGGGGSSAPQYTTVSGSTPLVRLYHKGEPVERIQRAVGATADGYFGPNTKNAVQAYQRKNGLTADGIVGPKTWAKINGSKPAPKPSAAPKFPLKSGHYFGPKSGPARSVSGFYSHREDLRRWQRQMLSRGWKGIGAADGLYETKTATVAKQFQREKKLAVDGLIGKATWDAAWSAPVT